MVPASGVPDKKVGWEMPPDIRNHSFRFQIRCPDEPDARERLARGGAAAQPLGHRDPKKPGAPAGVRAACAPSRLARGLGLSRRAVAGGWRDGVTARAPAGALGNSGSQESTGSGGLRAPWRRDHSCPAGDASGAEAPFHMAAPGRHSRCASKPRAPATTPSCRRYGDRV